MLSTTLFLCCTCIRPGNYFFLLEVTEFHSVLNKEAYGNSLRVLRSKKLLLVLNVPVKTKMTFLSRKLILLAISFHGQFIHHTQIILYTNTQFFIAQQCAYQSLLSYFLV